MGPLFVGVWRQEEQEQQALYVGGGEKRREQEWGLKELEGLGLLYVGDGGRWASGLVVEALSLELAWAPAWAPSWA